MPQPGDPRRQPQDPPRLCNAAALLDETSGSPLGHWPSKPARARNNAKRPRPTPRQPTPPAGPLTDVARASAGHLTRTRSPPPRPKAARKAPPARAVALRANSSLRHPGPAHRDQPRAAPRAGTRSPLSNPATKPPPTCPSRTDFARGRGAPQRRPRPQPSYRRQVHRLASHEFSATPHRPYAPYRNSTVAPTPTRQVPQITTGTSAPTRTPPRLAPRPRHPAATALPAQIQPMTIHHRSHHATSAPPPTTHPAPGISDALPHPHSSTAPLIGHNPNTTVALPRRCTLIESPPLRGTLHEYRDAAL